MYQQPTGMVKIAVAAVLIGAATLLTLSILLGSRAPGIGQDARTTPSPPATMPVEAAVAGTSTSLLAEESGATEAGIASLLPTVTPTPQQARQATTSQALPAPPVPENGRLYEIYPRNALSVGWARDNDTVPNHLGDYNIYAGVFDGRHHVGAVQFDLSSVPPGSPILYDDLTLTGLASDHLGDDGVWRVHMLHDWMDADWTNRDYYWLAREDSGAVALQSPVSGAELGELVGNTFVIPPEGLGLLEARLFPGAASFRVLGPEEGDDNLFSWDSGFGTRSMGHAPLLRIVTVGEAPPSPPTPTPNYVIVTPIPSDGMALLALAAERLWETEGAPDSEGDASPIPTETPLPPNWVTPIIVTNTPTPETEATAMWQAQLATAQAIVHGTPTATPPNVWTATPTPPPPPDTPTPMIVAVDLLTPTPTATPTPGALPDILPNKILFYSDRTGGSALMVMDPDGSNVALWTGGSPEWIYTRAKVREDHSPDGRFRVIVSSEQVSSLQLWRIDLTDGTRVQVSNLNAIAYDPVWSPVDNRIAFVSPAPGNDEIFAINSDGSGLTRLTHNEWEWDKHPSWSPDGSQLVFWSNRESQRKQIWIMNADGSNVRNLSNNEFNDWDPVWVK